MKTFVLQSKYDDNQNCELRECNYEDALVRSLELLGFSLLETEDDEGEIE